MGTAASTEPCVYERLWESIAVLRESGHRYGMSERDIERFITQVLQTNEPQPQDQDQDQDQPQPGFPLLRATAKWALALCLLLVLGLGLSPPQPPTGPLSLGLNWTCPLGAARLLDLPIAHKYNLRGFRGWWGQRSAQQKSLVNSSVCSEEHQPLVLKGGGGWTLQRPQLERLFQIHPDSVSILAQDGSSLDRGVPQGPANFSVHWRRNLLPLLFPKAQRPLLHSNDTALQRCVVSNLRHSPEHLHRQGVPVQGWLVLGAGQAWLSVSPLCRLHTSLRLELRPGDRVLTDPRLWRTELFPGPDQTIFCDGSSL